MRFEYECGCSVEATVDGYGGLDATFIKLCKKHNEEFMALKK